MCTCGQDLSKIKAYLVRQWTKQRAGQLTAKDFIFAKEVRIGTYSSNGALPPAAVVASKMMMADRRAEPRYGERVPYVVRDDVGALAKHGSSLPNNELMVSWVVSQVVSAAAGSTLNDRVVSPHQFLHRRHHLSLDARYYITKQVGSSHQPKANVALIHSHAPPLFRWFLH